MGNKRSLSPPIAFLVIFQLQSPRPRYFINAAPKSWGFSLTSFRLLFSKLSHDDGFIQSKTSDFARQQKNQETFWSTCLANDEAGKVSPRETNQTIVWHSQTFSTVKPESRRRDERPRDEATIYRTMWEWSPKI